jgi:Carboxypeptidase regulatory-like domain/TonB dependent receptor
MRKVSNSTTRRCRTQFSAFAVLLSMALLLAPCTTWAQKVTAAITGKVTDSSGAAIAGAKVSATDTERGTVQQTVTNGDGDYNLPQVPVGIYTVKVENPGFQAAQQSNLTLVLNQVARLDFQLQVGNVSTAVEVNAAPPLLQTESTDIGQIIDARTNTALPLATRNYVQLTLLAAGTVTPDPGSFKNGQTTSSSGRPYVNGNREQENNFMLDGMDNNQVSDNLVGYAPSVDAIQEFNEITSNAPAEFGNYMGGIVSSTIKSGTNQYHGDAFEFFRNNVLNANQWSSNFTGAPRAALRWNEFGGVLGGPIKKDKIFFFVDYQGQRFDTPNSTSAVSLLTAQERAGNFSAFLTQPKPIQLYNPFSLNANGTRVPFAGNIIPTSLLSPMALSIVNSTYYPVPTSSSLNNNYFNTTHSAINGDQGDAKVDWNIDDKDRLFARYSQSNITNPGTNSLPLFYNSFAVYPAYNGVLDWTRTISPSLVNDARAGVNYVTVNNGAAAGTAVNFPQTIGFPGATSTILPAMNMSGGYANTIGNADNYQLFADTVIQYGDTVTWNKGAHNLKFGFQGWRQRLDTFYSGNNGLSGSMNFNGQYTAGPCYTGLATNCTSTPGVGEADFMLGLSNTTGVGTNGGTWGQRANVFSAFAQDDWRVTSHLTLNLGLRWELHTPWVEVYNRQANFGLISGVIENAGQNGNSRALYNQYNGAFNFQPRLGFAYTPGGGKTVLRGSYSISSYLEGTGTNLRLTINPPFSAEKNAIYTSDALPLTTLDQGFAPIGDASNPYAGAGLRVWDPNVRPAVSEQYNFTIQHQFSNSVTFQAGYVGQKNTHLMVPMPYQQLELLPNGTTQESPYLSGNPTLKNEISQISGTASNGNQTYNALQAVLQKRLSEGLQFNVAYTVSKCMTDSSGYYGSWGAQATPTSPYWQNLFNQKAEWGPCYYDATQVLTAYATYDIPFGRSRKYGKDMNKVVNAVVGDWQVNGILSLHTGFPLTISANDASGTNSRGARADCTSPVQYTNYQNSPSGGYQWFSQTGFSQPSAGTFGSCGVSTVRGPGLKTFDFSVAKFFTITERQNIEFRSEFINLTNTPILNSPGAGLGSGLGLLQSSQGARNVQFALKYNF